MFMTNIKRKFLRSPWDTPRTTLAFFFSSRDHTTHVHKYTRIRTRGIRETKRLFASINQIRNYLRTRSVGVARTYTYARPRRVKNDGKKINEKKKTVTQYIYYHYRCSSPSVGEPVIVYRPDRADLPKPRTLYMEKPLRSRRRVIHPFIALVARREENIKIQRPLRRGRVHRICTCTRVRRRAASSWCTRVYRGYFDKDVRFSMTLFVMLTSKASVVCGLFA